MTDVLPTDPSRPPFIGLGFMQEVARALQRAVETTKLPQLEYAPYCMACQRNKITMEVFGPPENASETNDLRAAALRDLAYRDGAQQALAIAHQSLEVADVWLRDLWERTKEARATLKTEACIADSNTSKASQADCTAERNTSRCATCFQVGGHAPGCYAAPPEHLLKQGYRGGKLGDK